MSAAYLAPRAHWQAQIRTPFGITSWSFWVVLTGQTYLQGQAVVLTMPTADLRALSYAEVDARAIALAVQR